MKKLSLAILILILLTSLGLYSAYNWLASWGQAARSYPAHTVIELTRGAALKSFSQALEEKMVLENALIFEAWVRLFSNYRQFQAGFYLVPEKTTIAELVQLIKSGKTYNPVVYSITVPEGFTLKKVLSRLAENNIGSLAENIELTNDSKFIAELQVSAKSLEGYLYPATYPFTYQPTAKEVINLMVKTFWDNLPKDYSARAAERGLTLDQALTFASLIELETPHDFERTQVSEVIWNRLSKGMSLGIDASIIYGIKDYAGDLTFKHLKDASNLYNTRIHAGLPPGPICSSSKAAMLAVLNPTSFGYYYYVMNLETKAHHFSKNFNEHSKMVRKLIGDQKKLK